MLLVFWEYMLHLENMHNNQCLFSKGNSVDILPMFKRITYLYCVHTQKLCEDKNYLMNVSLIGLNVFLDACKLSVLYALYGEKRPLHLGA